MHRIHLTKTTGAHFVAALLAAAAVACDQPEIIDYCPEKECHSDGSVDGPRRDATLPPDSPAADSGMSRSPLCGMTGCVPGTWNACPAVTTSSYVAQRVSAADDASDGSDAATDGVADAGTDAVGDASGSSDAQADVCHDASHDALDVSVDIEPDASEDATTEPAPDAGEDAPADVQEEPDVVRPPPVDAGISDSGGRGDTTADIGIPDSPRITQSCYIRPAPTTGVITECAPVGPGVAGSACNDSRECGEAMACVDVDGRPVCSIVICVLPPTCMKGTYYREVPLRAAGTTRQDLSVPSCVLVDNCRLLEPNACPAGKACAVVGSEGDTTCLIPGSAKAGERCDEATPCAEGLLCAKASNECVKICRVAAGSEDCPTGTCQGGNRSLPQDFGICVGQQTDGGDKARRQ